MPDDYLDRLDAAFAALKSSARATGGALAPPPDEDRSPWSAVSQPNTPAGADAAAMAAPVPMVPAALVDEITRLVIARLADLEVRRIVLDTAERLVREEIELIKRART